MVSHVFDEDSSTRIGSYGVLDDRHHAGVGGLRMTRLKTFVRIISEGRADLFGSKIESVAKWFVDTLGCVWACHEDLERRSANVTSRRTWAGLALSKAVEHDLE